MSCTARCFAFSVVISCPPGQTLTSGLAASQQSVADPFLRRCQPFLPCELADSLTDCKSCFPALCSVAWGACTATKLNIGYAVFCASLQPVLSEASQTCLLATGTRKTLCPADQPCACPTKRTGLNAFECYDPTIQSCSDTAPTWPNTGKINGPGQSNQGACPCKAQHCRKSCCHACSHWLLHPGHESPWPCGNTHKPDPMPFSDAKVMLSWVMCCHMHDCLY